MTRRFLRLTALALMITAFGSGILGTPALAQDTATPPGAATDVKQAGPTLKQTIKSDTVYATVNGDKITGKDINDFIKKMPPQLQDAPAKLLEPIVNQMVNDRLVAKAAADQKMDSDPETQKMVMAAKEQIIRDRYVEKALAGKVTDAQVQAKYDEVVKNTPPQDEIRASHILVKDEATATEVLAKLKKGEDFAKLAKQYSIDPTKENGGDLGYFTQNAMVKEFGDAVFAMKKGETSKTPVKTQFGYHIIKVADRRPQKKPTFDQVKDRIRQQLTEEQIRDLVKGLRDKAKVDITLPAA